MSHHPEQDDFELDIELKDGSKVKVEIKYSFTPGTPDVPYLSNGDPGYPGDGEEVDIGDIKVIGVKPERLILDEEMSEETLRFIEEKAAEAGRQKAEDDYADAMEDRFDGDERPGDY